MSSPYSADFVPETTKSGLALCLSGGGFRAALFHLGSLRRLNQVGLLSTATTITSVSGGSITSALLAKWWPNFTAKDSVFENFPAFEQSLRAFCSHDFRSGPLLWERLDPRNWPMLLSEDHS